MQRRVFLLVLAAVVLGHAQAHPPEIMHPPTPMGDIDMATSLPIAARPARDLPQSDAAVSAFVSVSDLAAPERARKELEKANQSFARQNWTQARDRLNKAISLYPSFASAYNNLAVAYEHLGDVDQERWALQEAIALDGRFTLAHLNVGRLDLEEGKLIEAEAALNKVATLAPQDPRAFILLSYCQFLQQHFDAAIATSREAHKLSAPHAFVHRVAARAFERKRQFDRAATELNLFLREQPVGPASEAARKELQMAEAVPQE
jgi:tetratricopeptide (TPR) repeat protein